MVTAGHDSGPAEPSDGIGDSLVVCSYHNPAYERGLLDSPVNVFYQRLSIDFGQHFSRKTGGIVSGGNDRDGGLDLHQNTAPHLSMTNARRISFGTKVALQS